MTAVGSDLMNREFDFVVVGAGSARGVIATRPGDEPTLLGQTAPHIGVVDQGVELRESVGRQF
jgi:hypothetical protein